MPESMNHPSACFNTEHGLSFSDCFPEGCRRGGGGGGAALKAIRYEGVGMIHLG